MNSGSVEKACLEFRETAAVAIFAVKSKARPGLDRTFFATLFDTLSPFLPRFLKKSARPSAFIVLSLTIIDFIQLQITHFPTNNLISLPVFLFFVISPVMFFFVPDVCLSPTQ